MLNFLKENSYTVVKMMLTQFGLTLFGTVLALSTSKNQLLLVLSSIFSILFYMYLLYVMAWDEGAKQKIRVDGKRADAKPLNGIFISLCANVVNILLCIVILVTFFISAFKTNDLTVFTGPEWAVSVFSALSMISKFIQGMYIGLIATYSPYNPIVFILIILPSVIASGFGYALGLKGRRIGDIFTAKSTNR